MSPAIRVPRGREKLALLSAPGGVREDLNPAVLPDGALLASNNWLTRRGVGGPRPGYVQLGSTLTAADRIMGFGTRGSPAGTTAFVAHTITAAYNYDGTTATAITGTWTTSTALQHVRMISYVSGGTNWLLRTNHPNAIDKWDGAAAAFVDAGGTPPNFRDMCSVGGRVLGVYPLGLEHRVRWNDIDDVDSWTSTNFDDLDATPDFLVGCKPFGPLAAGIYKEDSVWSAVSQVARQPFQFQLIAHNPGPLSPAGIIGYRGNHYWLADDAVIYRSDGSHVEPFATGLPVTFRANLDWVNRIQTHAFVMVEEEPIVMFVYPVVGGTMDRGISVNLVTGAVNAHQFAHSITASATYIREADVAWNDLTGTWDTLSSTYATWDSMGTAMNSSDILGGTTGKVYQFGNTANDDGSAISWSFTHGWRAFAGLGFRFLLDGIVSYWVKLSVAFTVTVGVMVTDSLGDAETESTDTFDISTDSEHLETFSNLRGQWIRVRFAGASAVAGIAHRGAAILGWKRGMV